MALTPEERNAFYYGNPPAQKSLTDYIPSASTIGSYIPTRLPNIFGQENPLYSGLLGADKSQALSRQSNIAGLLGVAAALAQGMSKQGPRRSAAQNILSALGSGYGAAGQSYQQGLQNFSTAQQLQANADKQKAFDEMAAKYPELAPLARIDPAKFVEMVSQLEQQRPIAEAYKQAYGTPQPVQQVAPPVRTQADIAYENQLAAVEQDRNLIQQQNAAREQEYLKTLGVSDVANKDIFGQTVALAASAAPREGGDPQAGTAQPIGAELYPVPVEGRQADIAKLEQAPLPAIPTRPVPVDQPAPQVNSQRKMLIDNRDALFRVNSILSRFGTEASNKEIKNNIEQIKSLNTQIQELAVSEIDLSEFKNSLPENFRGQVDNLDKLIKKGIVSGNDVRVGMQQIADKATEYQQKLDDRTNEVRRTAAEIYPQTPLHKLDAKQMKQLNAVLLQRDKEARRSGAAQINVGDKVLAGERAKSQSKAEDNAINALNAASDVRAIVDVLKPYRGGALQDFAGSVGAYLPGTKLEQLATAKQVAEAIRAKLAPTLRVEGSGATSDKDLSIFMSAIPSLFNTAEGRELIATYSDKLAARSAAAADIRAQLIENGTYSVKRFQQELQRSGLTTVFTPEDLQILQQNKPAVGGLTPDGQRAFDKYKPR
jgi:hypothetical protein